MSRNLLHFQIMFLNIRRKIMLQYATVVKSKNISFLLHIKGLGLYFSLADLLILI